MENPFVGGKGKVAPYVSTHCRIPKPIMPLVQMLAGMYRHLAASFGTEKASEMLDSSIGVIIRNANVSKIKNQDEAITILKEALTYKANAGGKIKIAIKQAIQLLEEQ